MLALFLVGECQEFGVTAHHEELDGAVVELEPPGVNFPDLPDLHREGDEVADAGDGVRAALDKVDVGLTHQNFSGKLARWQHQRALLHVKDPVVGAQLSDDDGRHPRGGLDQVGEWGFADRGRSGH